MAGKFCWNGIGIHRNDRNPAGICGASLRPLEKGTDVNVQGGKYGNALLAASNEGYASIAWLLIENGADANAQGGYNGNKLQGALNEGHDAIAKFLIE